MPVRCPIARCGVENDTPVTTCRGCGADLRVYAAALRQSDLCFNRGLILAKEGEMTLAKVELQTCLYFQPQDEEAKLMYAKIALVLGSRQEANRILTRLSKTASDAGVAQQASACLEAHRRHGAKKTKRKKQSSRR